MIAASGLSNASSPAAPALPTSLPSSSETAGLPKRALDVHRRAQRQRAEVLGRDDRAQVEALVAQRHRAVDPDRRVARVDDEHLRPGDALDDVEVGDVAQDRQRIVALDHHAERLGDVESRRLDGEVRDGAVAHVHADVAVEAGQDLGGGAAAALDLDQRVELARDIGRRVALALQAQPLREVDAEQAQVGGPERVARRGRRAAGSRRACLARSCPRSRRSSARRRRGADERAPGRSGSIRSVPGSKMAMSMRMLASIARSDGRSNFLSGRTRPAAATLPVAASPPPGAGAPIVGPRSASSTREPPSRPASSGTLRPLVVGERAVELARADVGRVEHRLPEAARP